MITSSLTNESINSCSKPRCLLFPMGSGSRRNKSDGPLQMPEGSSKSTMPPSETCPKRRGFQLPTRRIVIPKIEPGAQGAFFTFTSISMATADDPVLRFVPYIRGASGHVNLAEFKETRLARDVRELGKGGVKKVDHRVCCSGKCPSAGGSKLREMRRLFCNVCLIFGCRWHLKTEGICIKPVGFEKNPSKAHLQAQDVCKGACARREGLKSILSEDWGDIDGSEELSRAWSESQGHGCIASLIFYLRHRRLVPCSRVREVCRMQTMRLKSAVENRRKGRVDVQAFFTPCDHAGSCSKKNGCVCISNRTNCEVSCLCTGCRNFFMGCKCGAECGSRCPCRSAMRECGAVCRCSACGNRDMQLGRAARTFLGRSTVAGYGLFAGEEVRKGRFVVEYTGEIISNLEAERRGAFYDLEGCSYLFDLCSREGKPLYVIDSRFVGSKSRFINHSRSKPNLSAFVLIVDGIRRVGFYASRDVEKGEELLFDYKYSKEHKKKHGIVD